MNHRHSTLIYAHRGANREAAENTLSAFERALRYPIDGIETDIQLTRNGVAVLWHDRNLNKLGLPDKCIDDYDYEALRAMNFSAHFEGASPEGPATLREFVEIYRPRCRLLLEIKNRDWEPRERHEQKVRQTLELVGEAKGDVLVSSFNLASLVYAHGLRPDFPLVLNLEPEHDSTSAAEALDAHSWLHGLCVSIDTLHEPMVGVVRACGKLLAVYTCNSDEEIERALRLGVDILLSDLPQKALALRDERRAP